MKYIISDKYDIGYQTRIVKNINRSIKTFKKNSKNWVGCNIKEVIKEVESSPIEIEINKRIEKVWAWTNAIIEEDDEIFNVKISFSEECFENRKLLYEIVSHETAHVVDMFLRRKTCHDKIWKLIHQYMNGSGETKIGKEDYQ